MKRIKEKIEKSYTYKLSHYIYRKMFFSNPVFLFFTIAIILNLIVLLLVSFKGRPENAQIPLHYIVGKGVDKTGNWYEVYYLPIFCFCINAVNFFAAGVFFRKLKKTLSYFLISATLVFNIFAVLVAGLILIKL